MAYKEKDTKKWTAQWFETNAKGEKKKRRKRGFETKREALEYERQKKLNNGRSMDMKLSEFMEVYFEDKQNELKERTMKNKRYMMQQHIIPYFGNQMMSEITAGQIIRWQNEMQTKGFSEAYLRMIQNQLTSLFIHTSRIYDLHTNPCKKVKRMGSSDNRSLDFWTVDEYQKFIQTMEPGSRYYLIFEILFWTGCRIGELLALTPKDIDFEIFASDIDEEATDIAYENALRAGVTDYLNIFTADARKIQKPDRRGTIICNPPYGERLMTPREAEQLYRDMGKNFAKFEPWQIYILTSMESFERHYGRRADLIKKLYNGMIPCNLYQYYKPKDKK